MKGTSLHVYGRRSTSIYIFYLFPFRYLILLEQTHSSSSNSHYRAAEFSSLARRAKKNFPRGKKDRYCYCYCCYPTHTPKLLGCFLLSNEMRKLCFFSCEFYNRGGRIALSASLKPTFQELSKRAMCGNTASSSVLFWLSPGMKERYYFFFLFSLTTSTTTKLRRGTKGNFHPFSLFSSTPS